MSVHEDIVRLRADMRAEGIEPERGLGTELFHFAGGKKTFGIFIRLNAPAPEIAAVNGEIRNKSRTFKIQLSGVKQHKCCQHYRCRKENSPPGYQQFKAFIAPYPEQTQHCQ